VLQHTDAKPVRERRPPIPTHRSSQPRDRPSPDNLVNVRRHAAQISEAHTHVTVRNSNIALRDTESTLISSTNSKDPMATVRDGFSAKELDAWRSTSLLCINRWRQKHLPSAVAGR
jgi:hypothetical protein